MSEHPPVPGQLDLLEELRRGKPLPPNTKAVARPSKWGNPYRCASTPAARAEAVEAYRTWLAERPELVAQARTELAGFDLACYCPLDGPCHRNVLLELVNAP